MAAKQSKKAKPSKTSTASKKAPSSKKLEAKSSKVKANAAAPKKAAASAPKKAAASAKAASTKAPAKATPAKVAAPAKTNTTKSGLKQEVSMKAKTAKTKPTDARRTQAAALIEAALEDEDEEENEEEDDFDPEAFLAASGGKGLIRSHTMRKERVDLNLPVRYRHSKGPMVYNATLLNLSKTGLCLDSKEKLKEKTVLRIEIPLPHTSELFAIQAEVIWTDKAPDSGSGKNATYHLGMNFLAMSLAKKTVINNFIQQRRDEIVMAKIGLDRFSESVPVAGLD
jgi:hypothetical protein